MSRVMIEDLSTRNPLMKPPVKVVVNGTITNKSRRIQPNNNRHNQPDTDWNWKLIASLIAIIAIIVIASVFVIKDVVMSKPKDSESSLNSDIDLLPRELLIPERNSTNEMEQAVRNNSANNTEPVARNNSTSQLEQVTRNNSISNVEQVTQANSTSKMEQVTRNNSTNNMKQSTLSNSTSKMEQAIQHLLSSMDNHFNPCEDFYKYACRGWIQSHNNNQILKSGGYKNSTHIYSQLVDNNFQSVKNLLDDTSLSGIGVTEKAQYFYASCISSPFVRIVLEELSNQPATLDTNHENNAQKAWRHLESLLVFPDQNYANESQSWDDPGSEELLDDDDNTEKGVGLTTEKLCVHMTIGFFPETIAELFVDKYFPSAQKSNLEILVEKMREAFISIVRRFPWMDFDSSTKVIREIRDMPIVAGYPQEVMDVNYVKGLYNGVEISQHGLDFPDNYRILKELRQPTKLDQIISSPFSKFTTLVNAYYVAYPNSTIFIPAGIAQFPFFEASVSEVLNFGKIGSLLAHEMTHALHTYVHGLYLEIEDLDYKLLLRPAVVSEKTSHNFKIRSNCVERQYSDYEIHLPQIGTSKKTKAMVNGTLTLKENVSDMIGIYIAFEAFRQALSSTTKLPPALSKFTKEQLFFISAAQNTCKAFANDETEVYEVNNEVKTNVHSPFPIRVLGQLSNFDEFTKAFNCPIGSKYNPTQKCRFF